MKTSGSPGWQDYVRSKARLRSKYSLEKQNLLTTKIHGSFERLKETDDDDQELCVIVQKYGQGVAKKGW